MKQKAAGQGFNEYALIIGLVVIVSVVGLGAVGMNLNQMFSNMITMDEAANTLPEATVATASPTGSAGNIPPPPLTGALPTEPVCFDGMCIHLPVVTAANSVVDTTGGNGAEHIYSFSNVLSEMATQLDLAGADPDLVQLISKLALNGHFLGDAQLEFQENKGMISAGNRPKIETPYNQAKTQFNDQYQQLTQYLAKHPDALNEVSSHIVDLQVLQIQSVANAVGPKLVSHATWFEVASKNTTLIHQSANTICDQGGKRCHRGSPEVTQEQSQKVSLESKSP